MTVTTNHGGFTFKAADLENGPILAPEYGFFVRCLSHTQSEAEKPSLVPGKLLADRTDSLPAFYVRDSGIPLEHRVDSAADIASIVEARNRLGMQTGILVTNPIAEADQVDPRKHEKVLQAALRKAAEENVEGKAMTPYILSYMQKNLPGVIEANIALVKSNAALGTQIAVALRGS